MTDREKAIVMAYTGISMFEGEKLNEFYQYLAELYGRPVYTHELIALDIEHKSKPDFLKLCEEEEPERKMGKWIPIIDNNGQHFICDHCGEWRYHQNQKFCGECGAKMEEYSNI